jgi:uncharacterized protein (DUF488 family)
MPQPIYTLGLSNHPIGTTLARLAKYRIDTLYDVRSWPKSRWTPQYNQDALSKSVRDVGVSYIFAGTTLGGRPQDPGLYRDGIADYEKMAQTEAFKAAITAILNHAVNQRLALTCTEHDPLTCHRCLLVGRALAEQGAEVQNILRDGSLESHSQSEIRLFKEIDAHHGGDLFGTEVIDRNLAYRQKMLKIAFKSPSDLKPTR